MGQIIQAEEIGSFRTTGITVCQAKKDNVNGVKSRFLALQMKEEKFSKRFQRYMLQGDTVSDIMFEEDVPGGAFTFDLLKPFQAAAPDSKGGYPVNLGELQKNEEVYNQIIDILFRLGGMMRRYYFRKGECYQNDVDNKAVMKDGKPVTREYVDVFCQASQIITDDQGNSVTSWAAGYSPEERGRKIEDTFYKHPVEAKPATAEEKPAEEKPAQTPAEEGTKPPF